MPPRPASPKPAAKKKDKEKGESTARAEGEGTAREGKKPAAKKAAAPSARKKVDEENLGENYVQDPSEPPREPDRLRVFLKISAETGNSVSSCVACESKSNHAWALDFDGQRAGAFVTLDGVFSQDVPETHMYPSVVQDLVNEFVTSKRGVATLMTYGQSEAGREALMYGEAGSRVNLTPRALPAPHHIQQQRAPGIVPAAFKATLAHVPTLINAGNQVEVHMGCVMLHMELLRDLLSPQSRVHLIESPLDGVQLDGLHWQAITDVKEAEGLLQLATQNKAVHTMQADNGFLDACHIITAIKLTTHSPEGSSISKLLYMVELAAPPLPRPSGVPGLNVEDFCALNSSLRGLIASLGAMARKGNSRPPLRDSKLTRILSGSFGKDHIRCHLFICVSQERQHAETTAELLSFGALAKCAKLGPNIYEAAAPRALCSQLQADLATIELPNEETYNEMCDQMKPQPAQLEKLAAAAASLRNKHQQAIEHMLQARGSFENQLQHLSIDSDGMQLEVAALSQQNDALRRQVRSVRQGEGVEMAMDALRESDERELSALSKQVNALQERLNSAKQEQARLHSQDQEKGLHALVDVSQQLVELGRKYTDKGMYAQALPVLQTALLSAEVGSSQNHKSVVGPLAALADLHIQQRREEEAIVLLKRAYTVDKEALGPDAPEVGHHLIGLGTAYHQQGKLEAAALTLEEARSILVYALGEKDEQVLLVKEKIKKLSVIEFDFNSGASGSNSAANSFAARMEARLAQKAVKADQLNLEAISKKQIAADLRRHGLLSARGTKAGEHFNYASHVAERVATEQEKRAAGERREMLTKKKQIFRERLRKRSDHGMNHDDDSDNYEEEEEERPETFAALEAEMMQVLGRSTKASQTEDWTEVVDCATQMEQLMHQVRNKSKGAACALRVLRSGVKPVGQDESRARSALAVLMMLEWCVPVCDSAFRQALAGERWVRRLVELARKDSSEKALVRATVSQLIVNWNSWYGLGFAQGVEMLAREGYVLPECTRMQDGTETPRVMVSPDSNAGPLILGGLQNSLAGTFAKESTESEEHVKQEMAVMRDDLELLRHAVQARKAGKLEVSELAEARQAANDCSGWLQRLGGLLGSSVGGQPGRTHRDSNNLAGFSEATKEALRVLQQEMAVLHRTFQAAYPGRKGFAMSSTPRASEMAAAQPSRCSSSLRLGGGMSGDSCSARAAPVPPVSVPKINISRTTESSQRSARSAGIPTMALPPAKLDMGAQLEVALAEDDDIRPRADDFNQMLMQEVAILQMQAEGWKAEWSIAMWENEQLRVVLFDAENALEQLPPKEVGEEGSEANEGADDEMQWRELCTSIARAADEEKATPLEELNMVRAELEHKRSTAFSTHDNQQRAEVEANEARANADNWHAQYEREQ
ncbi:kinesin heavy chain [Chrysochromulina tobinii]|uniref:Kinesin heavy chain n=1 Tax=Chrysochromulina tobinii TaxID=1460289 RepID=A0A0M0JM21_9EUKA|nr:kinesin heavy chain [Chrysochromulina tobinii]|eukprot:KOO27624.1 kinesin heavy chain [Chrysochromulina sp. CCMP291]